MTGMVVATGIATLLMVLLATTWATFGRRALEVEARARIQQEGVLAAEALARDFGGFLADAPPGVIEAMSYGGNGSYQYQFTDYTVDVNNPGLLLLTYSGTRSPPSGTIVVQYWFDSTNNLLRRQNLSTGIETTVAQYVTDFRAEAYGVNQVQITITIAYPLTPREKPKPYFKSAFTLIATHP